MLYKWLFLGMCFLGWNLSVSAQSLESEVSQHHQVKAKIQEFQKGWNAYIELMRKRGKSESSLNRIQLLSDHLARKFNHYLSQKKHYQLILREIDERRVPTMSHDG